MRANRNRVGNGTGFGKPALLALVAAGLTLSGLHADNGALHAAAAEAPAAPAPSHLRLISQSQYENTIAAIFGQDIDVKMQMAPVRRVDGLLAVGAGSAVLTAGALDPLDLVARSVADQVMNPAHRDLLMPCKPADIRKPDPACARTYFSSAGRLLYRRALTPGELDGVVAEAGRIAGTSGNFYTGMSAALSGMLVSMPFLYIRDREELVPGATNSSRLDGYSKASRLSFLLWDAAPDDQLLAAAENGELHSAAGLKRQVDRLLASPRYKMGVRAFFSDFLVTEDFDNLSKDSAIYPAFSLKAGLEAREQTLRTVVDHIVTRKGDYRDLYTTRHTFLSAELAILYGIPVNTGSTGWVPYDVPAGDPRAGLLTQIGFLAQYSPAGRSSPTKRGKAIRTVLLCQEVPDPPVNVDFSKFEGAKGGATNARQRLSVHNENPVCAGCHSLTDPIGLALENFDGAGQFRKVEEGTPIDARGTLDDVAFKDAAGLGIALRNSTALKSCIVNRLYSYSTGRKISSADEPLLKRFEQAFDKSGYYFDQMFRQIIFDDSFFTPGNLRPAAPGKIAFKGEIHAHQN